MSPGAGHQVLVGPTGCGKTTLIRNTVEWYRAAKGTVWAFTRNPEQLTFTEPDAGPWTPKVLVDTGAADLLRDARARVEKVEKGPASRTRLLHVVLDDPGAELFTGSAPAIDDLLFVLDRGADAGVTLLLTWRRLDALPVQIQDALWERAKVRELTRGWWNETESPAALDDAGRLSHQLVLGDSGSGKTQLVRDTIGTVAAAGGVSVASSSTTLLDEDNALSWTLEPGSIWHTTHPGEALSKARAALVNRIRAEKTTDSEPDMPLVMCLLDDPAPELLMQPTAVSDVLALLTDGPAHRVHLLVTAKDLENYPELLKLGLLEFCEVTGLPAANQAAETIRVPERELAGRPG
jgi:energy-coupling factor transporter ATP-binding protein EcfA2